MDKNQPFEEFDSEDDFDCESRMDADVCKYTEPQRKIYKFLGIDSTESLEGSNEASRTYTPSRKPLPFKETNSPGRLRQIYVKYRPVRKFVEGRGLKGMLTNVASYLQTIGHWALVIGPYTYDVYEKNGSICVFVGEWEEAPAGEEDRIKMKEVGKTVCTDKDIWKIGQCYTLPPLYPLFDTEPCQYFTALMVYIRMKREKYDIGFNNCQRFVRLFARRIALPEQRSLIGVLIVMQRVYRMLPASFFTSAYQYSRCAGRVCLDILRDFVSSELLETVFEHIRRTAKVSFRAAFFLLTAGLLFGFLNMVRELKGWDVVEDRSKYVELLERFGFKDAELQHICLRGAFEGPNGMKDFFRQVVSKRRLLEGV
ncbi:uncharacterized protein Z519_00680 [Cladophialophora bantiana CBS 173.52]|uniref:PPPDE domain-containing protein n=1 Tax=Cladophialophora bantiana (strain ATCC 10958 / CBS 173.52 / CDC B-1940 / NIH 8579) TaxID=1442370 RepID=A0A0D2GKV1_CLAB1|nr:uncharacterized protein Z519_00680 [Cladophialophora bantiana CBS 173.52]KIW99017.1 hypothetical protein Z519_00680 [Cladophialophora bantiana CBS 173.52]